MQARGAVDWLVWNESVSAREANGFHTAPLRMLPSYWHTGICSGRTRLELKRVRTGDTMPGTRRSLPKLASGWPSGRDPRVCGNSGDVICYAVSLIHMVYSLRMGRLCFT